jgi:hypothetical protein
LLRWCFRHEQADKKQEMVQDAICRAWGMYVSAYQRGKRLSAHGLTWYAWLQTKSGRRFCQESKTSVQTWCSVETVAPDDLLAMDSKGKWPVDEAAAFKIDWSAFVRQCTAREAKAMTLLALGHKRSHVARKLGVSPSWMTLQMDKLKERWQEFTAGDAEYGLSLAPSAKHPMT